MRELWSDDTIREKVREGDQGYAVLLASAYPQLAAALIAETDRDDEPEGSPIPVIAPAPPSAPPQPVRKMIPHIAKEVCLKHGVTKAQITGEVRQLYVARARQEIMWRCMRELPHATTTLVGTFLNRDHTTVIHGCRKHQRRVDAGLA